jgi:hypothetical protein
VLDEVGPKGAALPVHFLAAVESELRAMKDVLAKLKVNQDEPRQDRDE